MYLLVTQTRKIPIELENYKNIVDSEGATRSLTDPDEILQFEKEQWEQDALEFEEIDCIVGTTCMLVKE